MKWIPKTHLLQIITVKFHNSTFWKLNCNIFNSLFWASSIFKLTIIIFQNQSFCLFLFSFETLNLIKYIFSAFSWAVIISDSNSADQLPSFSIFYQEILIHWIFEPVPESSSVNLYLAYCSTSQFLFCYSFLNNFSFRFQFITVFHITKNI